MRLIHENKNLSGQTLKGPARESLIRNCNIDGTVFLGDWRGTDYLGNTGAADWSKAMTYGSYWRGNKGMEGAKFPPDIGFFHHVPVAEILRQGLSRLSPTLRPIGNDIPAYTLTDYTLNSWDTAWDALISKIPGATKANFIETLRICAEGFPGLLGRIDRLEDSLAKGVLWKPGKAPYKMTVHWQDGAEVVLDAMNLPSLPEPTRYALKSWLNAEADKLNPDMEHHCFVFSIFPPAAITIPEADMWLDHLKRGY
jgi:hypothetical protein